MRCKELSEQSFALSRHHSYLVVLLSEVILRAITDAGLAVVRHCRKIVAELLAAKKIESRCSSRRCNEG